MRAIVLFCMIVAATLVVRPADAQTVDGSDPKAILQAAQNFGSANLVVDSYGDPMIEASLVEGIDYRVVFYGCTNGQNCSFILFYTYFDVDQASMDKVNAYNAGARVGRAYVDRDGDVAFEYGVNLAFGVTPDNLRDTFDYWRVTVTDFKEKYFSN